MEKQLEKCHAYAKNLLVEVINLCEFKVIGGSFEGVMKLKCKSYTCKKFDMDQYPCDHAIVVVEL